MEEIKEVTDNNDIAIEVNNLWICLLYTSDAADEL